MFHASVRPPGAGMHEQHGCPPLPVHSVHPAAAVSCVLHTREGCHSPAEQQHACMHHKYTPSLQDSGWERLWACSAAALQPRASCRTARSSRARTRSRAHPYCPRIPPAIAHMLWTHVLHTSGPWWGCQHCLVGADSTPDSARAAASEQQVTRAQVHALHTQDRCGPLHHTQQVLDS